ncbi:MAG: DUF359 domain-containing protein [Candidatus Bathyarchaeia archaeon]
MGIAYSLPQKLRRQLQKPWGTLLRGSFSETASRLKDIVRSEKPPSIVSVGDTVSKNLVENKIFPNLLIVDNRVMRAAIKPASLPADKEMHVKNPQGTVTQEALNTIKEAFKANCRVKIVVDGEEDLLTLAAVLYAPENSIVVYGQPREGIVVVKATQEKKAEAAEILKAMGKTAKD